MSLERRVVLERGDVFDSNAEALLVTVDGAGKRSIGAVANQVRRKIGDEAWNELISQIEFPMKITHTELLTLPEDIDFPFRHIIVGSFIDHMGELTGRRREAISDVTGSAMLRAHRNGISKLATAPLRGGWRVPVEKAVEDMIVTAVSIGRKADVRLIIRLVKDYEKAEEAYNRLNRFEEDHAASG